MLLNDGRDFHVSKILTIDTSQTYFEWLVTNSLECAICLEVLNDPVCHKCSLRRWTVTRRRRMNSWSNHTFVVWMIFRKILSNAGWTRNHPLLSLGLSLKYLIVLKWPRSRNKAFDDSLLRLSRQYSSRIYCLSLLVTCQNMICLPESILDRIYIEIKK
jgi:hypothetical protein